MEPQTSPPRAGRSRQAWTIVNILPRLVSNKRAKAQAGGSHRGARNATRRKSEVKSFWIQR
jgi:hypothetical protein